MSNQTYKDLLSPELRNKPCKLADDLKIAVDESKDLKTKEYAVHKDKVIKDYSRLENENKLMESVKRIDLEELRANQQQTIASRIDAAIERTRDRSTFIGSPFVGKIDLTPGTLLVVGGSTGTGKSTTTANCAYEIILQGKKVAILSNEETVEDVFSRVACLSLDLDFNARNEFTPSQRLAIGKKSEEFSQSLTVFDDQASGNSGATTTLRGVKALLGKLEMGGFFTNGGALILDYYQNVRPENPGDSAYQDLKSLSNELQKLKNQFPVPIIVMAQMRPPIGRKDGGLSDYFSRVCDCKAICQDATCVVEAVPFRKHKLTLWAIHKNRFGSGDRVVITKWKNGRYVSPSEGDEGVKELTKMIGDNL